MKKTLLFAIVVSVLLTGCAVSEQPPLDANLVQKVKDSDTEVEVNDSMEHPTEEPDTMAKDDAYSDEAVEHFIDYLLGNEKNAEGASFWAVGEEDVEFALLDVNDDGQCELIVRSYGEWIPDIIEYKDNKIVFANVENMGSSGVTYINTNNQFVSGDTSHEDREQYWISEIDKDGNSNVVLYFARMTGEWAELGEIESFYKCINPPQTDFTTDDCEKISVDDYYPLLTDHVVRNMSIKWNKVTDIDKNNIYSYVTVEKTEDDEASDINIADVYKQFLTGNVTDFKGNYFDAQGSNIDYVILDLNNDDREELLVRVDGLIMKVYYINNQNKVVFLTVTRDTDNTTYIGMPDSVINTRGIVCGEVSENSQKYWKYLYHYSPDETFASCTPIFYFEKDRDDKGVDCYHYVIDTGLDTRDISKEDCEKMDEEVYDWMFEKCDCIEDTSITWNKLSDIK